MGRVKVLYESVRPGVEMADVGFLLLRVVVVAGIVAWLLVAPVPGEMASAFLRIAAFFVAYGLLIYALLLFRFAWKKRIYRLSFLFDLLFIYFLIVSSGGFASNFFLCFYLLTALHAFYYGPRSGMASAAACVVVYLLAGLRVSAIEPVDFLLRVSFLFLVALPIGMLSGMLRSDKERIESLNRELVRTLETTRSLQGRLVEAEKLSALGRLTADVAHEIRNPLTAIGGFAKRLEKLLPAGTRESEYARIVVSEVARLERILRDTLTFSRHAKYHLRHVDLNELLHRAEAEFAEACAEKRIRLAIRKEVDLPSCIADGIQVRQAIDNLVANAIDATPEGGRVTLSTRRACEHGVNYVVVDVTDTGQGVPPDLRDRIFEPFYSTKEIGQGTGLGLSICKKIMEEHGGAVRVLDAPSRGSVFSLFIPFLPPEETFKAQCWEVMRCGVEKIVDAPGRCPAYPNFGRICWSVAGTLSETKVECAAAWKIGDCRKCPFHEAIRPSCPGEGRGSGAASPAENLH